MIGRKLSHYQILKKLGEGGMGAVYQAHDLRLDRLVALKVLRPDAVADLERKKRFIREARAVSALNHPNIITIYDIDSDEGMDFIAMEYVEGRTLEQCVTAQNLSVEQALACMTQVADALSAAHQKGIVHRDLKPANLMIGEHGRVKVLDFGVAKLIEPVGSGGSDLTRTGNGEEVVRTEAGAILGTLAFMSPEQALGLPVDARSDIFSFGAVLYELISGRRAFARASRPETLSAVIREEPDTLSGTGSGPLNEIAKVVTRCLRKEPDRRFQGAVDLKIVLEEIAAELRQAGRLQTTQAPGATIAVLPFADMSPQKDQEYFCDGVAEEIINALTKVGGLRVASRTSAFQFKGKAEDIGKIGAQLKARMVLEGSVRQAGDRVRITAQLINAADGYHLWSERYDRDLKDIFAIQDEIARAVVETLLRTELLGEKSALPVKRHTTNPKAYDLFLRGRHFWHQWSEEAYRKAIDYFERAISEDPGYATAYAMLGDCCGCLAYWGGAPSEVWQKARAAATKALQLDGTLAEAYSTIGMIRSLHDFDWWDAERAFRRAIELDPNSPGPRTWFHTHLCAMGRVEEGLSQLQHALETDPLSIAVNGSFGIGLYYSRRYEDSVQQWRKTMDLDNRHPRSYYYLGRALLGRGMLAEALEALEEGSRFAGSDRRMIGVLGYAHAAIGNRGEAERLLAGLEALPRPAAHATLGMAFIYLGLGLCGQALDSLERVYQENASLLRWLKVDPLFDSVRPNPRFAALLKGMGLD